MSRFSAALKLAATLLIPALLLAGCQADLYTKLTETEANEIVALLYRKGISANRTAAKDGTSTVRVEEGSFADAVALLNSAGLPHPKFATMGDVFPDTKLVSSPVEERARFIYALSQELSKTLSEIDGVITARVHLVLPKNDPLREDAKPSSASVFIKHDRNIAVASLLPQIKTFVTNSIEGLTYEKVSVVFVPGDRNAKLFSASTAQMGSGVLLSPGWHSTSEFLVAAAVAFLLLGLASIYYLTRQEKAPQLGEIFQRAVNRNRGVPPPGKAEDTVKAEDL
jgi:type III secretion protein J